jgi:hypothetical protein
MVANIRNIIYFCIVKLYCRHEAAAISSVFCVHNLLVNSKRNEWGYSNAPKVFDSIDLTARIALSLCSNYTV